MSAGRIGGVVPIANCFFFFFCRAKRFTQATHCSEQCFISLLSNLNECSADKVQAGQNLVPRRICYLRRQNRYLPVLRAARLIFHANRNLHGSSATQGKAPTRMGKCLLGHALGLWSGIRIWKLGLAPNGSVHIIPMDTATLSQL